MEYKKISVNACDPLGVACRIEIENFFEDDEVWKELVDAMESENGQGVLVIKGLDLSPNELEQLLHKIGKAMNADPLKYDRWPGQSKNIEECPYLALLGNYVARKDNDLGVKCKKGQGIAEFKPATNKISEWHTDGSFLASPKQAIALYAPYNIKDALPLEGGETRFASCVRGLRLLSPELRAKACKTSAVHSWETFMRFLEARDPSRPKVTAEDVAKKPDQTWPLVRNCTTTAGGISQECLYLNPKNTKRLIYKDNENAIPTEIPKDFIDELAQYVLDSGVYAHKWEAGDFVIWNNSKLLHAASPFDHTKYQRLLFRCEFKGKEVQAPLPKYIPCTVESVAWGYLSRERKPVLSVQSGDVVTVDTVSGSESVLPINFDTEWNIPPELKLIHNHVSDRLGPHILTGPIAIQRADPSRHCLQIDILDIKLRSDWSWTFSPSRTGGALGTQANGIEFDVPRHTRLEPGAGWAKPSWGGVLDIAPFFGVLGVAPPQYLPARVSSIPPSEVYGGNLDLKMLTAGSTLYLPIHSDKVLLYIGDGHARQGDGECCGTALETALQGTFRLSLIAIPPSFNHRARAETNDSLITIGIVEHEEQTFETAAQRAISSMLDWLCLELRPNLNRTDAYCLISVAGDIRVTQLVNSPTRGTHLVLPKRVLPPLIPSS